MPEILTQVSNIPLTAPSTPARLTNLKGCRFFPGVFLDRGKLYFVVITHRPRYIPEPGFYDVPDKGYLTWIDRFVFKEVSMANEHGAKCWVFEAMEGHPPKDRMPDLANLKNMGLVGLGG